VEIMFFVGLSIESNRLQKFVEIALRDWPSLSRFWDRL
jgi:hypothetical protein